MTAIQADTNTLLYQITNLVNQKTYLGITKRGLEIRKRRHIHTANSGYGSVIGAALRKYGAANFSFKTLAICPDFQYAKELEVAAIKVFKPEYNVTAGGDGAVGFRHSEEHKKRISEQSRGVQHWLGRSHSPETREKMRLARLKYWAGIPHSRKKYKSSYKKRLVNSRYKPIVLENTGQIFPTMDAAASWAGCHRSTVRAICQGTYKSRKGFRFKYLSDIDKP